MRASEDGELLPPVVVEVPDVLYLQVVDTDDCEDWPAPSEPDERTFTTERLNASDVAYVPLARAERAEAAIATERDAAAEAELASVLVLLGGGDPAESESEDMATAVVDAIFALRAERDDLRAQLDAMHRKASNLELELEQSERQRREISDMADKMADKWTLQVEQLRARLDAAQEAAHMPDDWPHGLPSWIAQRLYAAYIGAAFAPEVMEQIAAGRLAFPEAPIYAEAAALRAELAAAVREVEGIFDSAAETELRLNATIDALRAERDAARGYEIHAITGSTSAGRRQRDAGKE